MRSNLHAFRRTAAIGALWALGMGGLVATTASAQTDEAGVEPGVGSAYAQGYKIDPRSGRLSFGITYGLALAGHQNNVAVGEARSVDLGVIGTTLAAEGCDGGDPTFPKEDQPQPLVVRSTEENSGAGRTETENAVEKQAKATDQPFAESVAITAASGDPAAVRIGSTTSRTVSGIVDGSRRATAITEVGDVTFAGGAVVLTGLRWIGTYQSAPAEEISGSFTIEGIESAGRQIPVDDVVAGLAQVNEVLDPLGFFLDPPTVRNESGIVFVDPLRIGIEPSPTRDGVLGPAISALSPVRQSVFDALIEADCSNASYITIADIVLGSVTGAGSLNIELGGVTASSGDLGATSMLGALPNFISDTPPGPSLGSGGATSGGGGSFVGEDFDAGGAGATDTTDAGTVDPTPAASTGDETAIAAAEPASGSRGGPLVGVGLGGLALLAALAEGDRRKMRRAQRSVPMEVMA